MKIDKQKLIELLVEKTGMEKPDVQEQLNQLIKRIVDAAERGKALEIKEFGLFYFDEEGDLKFDPAEELSTEINFKYAGMEPVELKAARDSSAETEGKEGAAGKDDKEPEPEPKEDDIGDIFGLDEADEQSAIEEELSKKPAPPESRKSKPPIESKPDKVERESDPFSGLLGDASTKLSESDSDKDSGDDVIPEPPSPRPGPKPAKKEEAPKTAASVKEKKESSRDPITVVMSVVLVFVFVAAGFFIIPVLFQQPDQPAEPIAETEQVPEEVQIPEEELDTPNVLTPLEPEEETEVTEEIEETVEEAEPEQPRYGLTGELVEEANDGFSIVLHSLRSEGNARAQAALLAAEGYRVLVSPRVVNDETVWRVSVGQFPSIPAAQEEARELPSPYNTNNFIQRIQTN